MASIPYVDENNPEARDALAFAIERRGAIGTLHRQMAYVPALVEAFEAYSTMVRSKLPLEFGLFGLLVLRTVQAIDDPYQWRRCVPIARRGGVPDAQILELWNWRASGQFDARQKAALAIVDEHCIEKPERPIAAEAARSQLSEAEIVAVCTVIGWYLVTAAFTKPLRLVEDDPLEPPEPCAIDARSRAA